MAHTTIDDPEELAFLYVQQYLYERGHIAALSALEASSGILYDADKLLEGSQLMKLLWDKMERQLATADVEAPHQLDDEQLLRGGQDDYPRDVQQSIEGLHSSSITSIRWITGTQTLITGSGSGIVQRFSAAGAQEWSSPVGSGGALSIAVHPAIASGQPYIAVGSMGGQVSVIDARTGDLLASAAAHSKYVVRVLWSADGQQLLSCSWDQSVAIHRVHQQEQGQEQGAGGGMELQEVAKVPFAAAVQDIALMPDGSTLAVAVRDTNYLRLYDTSALRELPPVNLNSSGDDHVSFYARHLALSPCGKYLLICTDSTRMLVLRTADWSQSRVLYGLPVDQFHQPCAAWHRDSSYVMVAGAAGQLLVFHVGSSKLVASVKVHEKGVRDVAYSGGDSNLLATCSFDKTVKVLCWLGQAQ